MKALPRILPDQARRDTAEQLYDFMNANDDLVRFCAHFGTLGHLEYLPDSRTVSNHLAWLKKPVVRFIP